MIDNSLQERQELGNFIKNKVLGDYFDFDSLVTLREYIEARSNDENGGDNGAFCDYFELGNWFWDAMESCEFEANDFLDEVEQELEQSYREAAQDRVEAYDEYLHLVGAK